MKKRPRLKKSKTLYKESAEVEHIRELWMLVDGLQYGLKNLLKTEGTTQYGKAYREFRSGVRKLRALTKRDV